MHLRIMADAVLCQQKKREQTDKKQYADTNSHGTLTNLNDDNFQRRQVIKNEENS